ncbi:MAG TPA: hypothetical protein VE242_03060, partial [Chthoniobacterales bacterium]|nr:hypothetical protein [Chthoniobacterales bacterium]
LAIEDSNNGLFAALAAGLPTLITRSFYCSKDSFEGAAAIVDNLDGSSDLGQPQAASVTVQQIRRWHHHWNAGH